jgi:hypothetical protein
LQRKSPEVEALLPALVDQDQLMTLNLIRSSLHERFSTDPVFAISNQLKVRAMTVVFKGLHDLSPVTASEWRSIPSPRLEFLHLVLKSDNVLVFTQLKEDLDKPGQGHKYEALYHQKPAAFLANAGP